MKHRKVHMIYMAAGNSRRFQGNKLLYTISGKALYRYGLETLIEVQKNYPDTTLTVVVQEWAIYDSAFSAMTGRSSPVPSVSRAMPRCRIMLRSARCKWS